MTKNDTARKTGVVTESSGGGFSLLPHSFIGWIVYTLVAVLVVVLFVRMRAYYLVKKKEIEEQEKQSMRTKAA
jgi:predicted membrane protein